MKYLLDQNFLRRIDLSTICESEPDAIFAIPDIALIEMTKMQQWELTLAENFRIISQNRNRVYLADAISAYLKFELQNKTCVDDIFPQEIQHFLDDIYDEIIRANPTAAQPYIRNNIANLQREFAADYLDYQKNINSVQDIVAVIKRELSQATLDDIRLGRASDQYRLNLIKEISQTALTHFLGENGFSDIEILAFINSKPMLLRHYYVKIRYALEWATTRQGLDNANARKITNDIIDLEYVCIASYFDKFLSGDNRALATDNDLRAILAN